MADSQDGADVVWTAPAMRLRALVEGINLKTVSVPPDRATPEAPLPSGEIIFVPRARKDRK